MGVVAASSKVVRCQSGKHAVPKFGPNPLLAERMLVVPSGAMSSRFREASKESTTYIDTVTLLRAKVTFETRMVELVVPGEGIWTVELLLNRNGVPGEPVGTRNWAKASPWSHVTSRDRKRTRLNSSHLGI